MASYSLEELRRHNHSDSLWVARSGNVYDVTAFADRHPGGIELLLGKGGEDVTGVMETSPHIHSPAAFQILNKYLIGKLDCHRRAVSDETTGLGSESKNGGAKHHASNNVDTVPTRDVDSIGTTRDDIHTGGHSMHGWREDEIVNWNEPIFWQVGKLGKNYYEWVHSPVDRHIRLFYSDFVEFFSETTWWVIPLLWLPILVTFLILGVRNLSLDPSVWIQLSWLSVVLSWVGAEPGSGFSVFLLTSTIFFSGLLLWTFLEYTLHRWLFHINPPADSPLLITLHFILHGQHHKTPFDKGRLVFPPVPASGFALVYWMLLMFFFPKPMAQIMMSGTILGYVSYDLTHYFLHHGRPYFNYFKRLKSYHVKHHFIDQQKGFGISSKFWDYPFQTLIPDNSDPTEVGINNNKKTS